MTAVSVVPQTREDCEICPCCGKRQQVLTGLATDAWDAISYLIFWTPGRAMEDGATFDFLFKGPPPFAVSTILRWTQSGPWFGVIDVPEEKAATSGMEWRSRSEVIGTPLAPRIFAAIDAIWLDDPRLSEFRSIH